jgi:hypothetical protein
LTFLGPAEYHGITILIHEINDDLVVHKKVFRMTQLLEKYKAYLPAGTGTYSSAKLQDRLVKNYAGSIVMHTHADGMSLRMVVIWPGLLLFLLQVEL